MEDTTPAHVPTPYHISIGERKLRWPSSRRRPCWSSTCQREFKKRIRPKSERCVKHIMFCYMFNARSWAPHVRLGAQRVGQKERWSEAFVKDAMICCIFTHRMVVRLLHFGFKWRTPHVRRSPHGCARQSARRETCVKHIMVGCIQCNVCVIDLGAHSGGAARVARRVMFCSILAAPRVGGPRATLRQRVGHAERSEREMCQTCYVLPHFYASNDCTPPDSACERYLATSALEATLLARAH